MGGGGTQFTKKGKDSSIFEDKDRESLEHRRFVSDYDSIDSSTGNWEIDSSPRTKNLVR